MEMVLPQLVSGVFFELNSLFLKGDIRFHIGLRQFGFQYELDNLEHLKRLFGKILVKYLDFTVSINIRSKPYFSFDFLMKLKYN